MFWIGLGARKSEADIASVLQTLFPSALVRDLESYMDEDPVAVQEIVFDVRRSKGEFATVVHFWGFPAGEEETTVLELARQMSDALGCKTIGDASNFGEEPSPFNYIVWDQGQAWLVDHQGDPFSEGPESEMPARVNVVRKVDVPKVEIAR